MAFLAAWADPPENRSKEQLCTLMEPQGLRGSAKWRAQGDGFWGCSTARKSLSEGEPAGASDVRYRVLGSEIRPQKLVLELRMRSDRAPQRVLDRFHRYVESMVKEATGQPPPDGVREAVMTPAGGEWVAGGYRFALEKRFSRGPLYDLWFTVELPSESRMP